jgi:hypothetical protein
MIRFPGVGDVHHRGRERVIGMQRARRLASVAVVASLAVAGLSACRSEPSVAAYVGDAKITESRVQGIWDEAREAFAAAPAPSADPAADPAQAAAPASLAITRADVVRTLLSVNVLTEVAKRESLTLPADLSVPDYAAALRVPENTEYVRLFAEADTYIKLLRQKAQNAPAATDADLREVFDVLSTEGQVPPGTSFEAFKTALPEQNKVLVQSAAAVRNEINEVTGGMGIRINPRYQPLGIPVLEFQLENGNLRPLVVAKLGATSSSPVTDLS